MTPETALTKYHRILEKEAELRASIATDLAQLEIAKKKAQDWLRANATDLKAPEWLLETDPETYWEVSTKTDEVAATCYMHIRDKVVPSLEQAVEPVVKELKGVLESIEQWSLAELQKRGSDSFKVNGVATVSVRENVKYSIPDKALFVRWAVENNAESELTVSLRPNSKFMKGVLEQTSELPPGVGQFRENKVVYTKN